MKSSLEEAIAAACNDLSELPPYVAEAIRYAAGGGGKRLRGMLVVAAYEATGGTEDVSALGAAVEIVHAYSLVHDDLPCMDDDDMRRGRPAAHRVFGVQTATLAGTAMVPLAARLVHRAARDLQLPAGRCCKIVSVLAQAAGAGGMIGGQVLDLEAEDATLTRADLDAVHAAKTGSLISGAVRIGGIAAGADEQKLLAFDRFGLRIGLAFQVMDDVLDVTGSSEAMGKLTGRDIQLGKSTYPRLMGVDSAVETANRLVSDALDGLRENGLLTRELEKLGSFVLSRSH